MSIWDLIGRAYAAPFERWRAAVTVFWLPGVLWLLSWVGLEANSVILNFPSTAVFAVVAGLVVVISLLFYQSIVMASGLVRWHQHLIAGAPARSARLWLSRQEGSYWWRWFTFGTIWCLMTLPLLLMVPSLTGNMVASDPDALATPHIGPTWSTIATAWIYVLTMGLTCWLFPRLSLSRVAVAIEDGQSF